MIKFSKINESKTSPWFKKGEIIVKFVDGADISDEVVNYLLKKLNLSYKKEGGRKPVRVRVSPNMELDYYIINVPVGKEDEMISAVEKEFGKDVDWVIRRDLRFELRSFFASYVSDIVENMSEDTEMSDQKWMENSEFAIDLLNLIKSDNYEEIKKKYPNNASIQDKFDNI